MYGCLVSKPVSKDQLTAFLEAVKADTALQVQLKSAKHDDVIAIAKTAGFVISAEDLERSQVELSDEELENVAGGVAVSPLTRNSGYWPCTGC